MNEMVEINNSTLEEIKAEYAKWAEFLNGGVGILSFSFGLACLGTPRPDITGFPSICFLLMFALHARKYILKKMEQLEKSQKRLDELSRMILIGFKKEHFGIRALVTKFLVYFTGWLFLAGVALYGIAFHEGWF